MAGNKEGVEREGSCATPPSIELSSSAAVAEDEGSLKDSLANELGRTITANWLEQDRI